LKSSTIFTFIFHLPIMAGTADRPTALERLIAEPKGKTTYAPNQAFLLHVFWECPTLSAAQTLLQSLATCAAATHRDTPCVPIYFFRISHNNNDLCTAVPHTVGDHPALQAAFRKIRVGVPRSAVKAELVRQGLDASLLDLELSSPLPLELQQTPVAVECTELYLDERAFNEHAGSREYLDAYAGVMNPALRTRTCTVRTGTPSDFLVERVLEPMLKEKVVPLFARSIIWQSPTQREAEIFLSLDVALNDKGVEELVDAVPLEVERHLVMKLAFEHPLRLGTARFMAVLSSLPPQSFEWLKGYQVSRGEIHCDQSSEVSVLAALRSVGVHDLVKVNASESIGYILHTRAQDVYPISE
jgi:hypothetical protein